MHGQPNIKISRSSLCSFLHSPVTSSLLGPNIILNTLFLNTLQHTFLSQCERPSFTPIQNNRQNCSSVYLILSFLYRASFQHKKWKTNRCHCLNFTHTSTDLYMFRVHRPIFRRIHTAVPTTIGSVSVPFWSRVLYEHTEHATRTIRILNQWLWEQLCEFSWRWACGPETCRDPSMYEWSWGSDIGWFFISCAVYLNPNFVKTVQKCRTLYVKIRYVSDCWQEYRQRLAVLAWLLF